MSSYEEPDIAGQYDEYGRGWENLPVYKQIEKTPSYEVGRRDGELLAACSCGSGLVVPDKGLGRATLGAWKSRHGHCDPA